MSHNQPADTGKTIEPTVTELRELARIENMAAEYWLDDGDSGVVNAARKDYLVRALALTRWADELEAKQSTKE